MRTIVHWFTRGWLGPDVHGHSREAPAEAVVLRVVGLGFLIAAAVATFTTTPAPGLSGRGPLVLAGLVVMVVSAVIAMPRPIGTTGNFKHARDDDPDRLLAASSLTVVALFGVVAGSIALGIEQPRGFWQAGPYFVAIMAALRLSRRDGILMLLVAILPFTIASLVRGHVGTAVSVSIGIVPWYLVLRLMRRLRDQNFELDASRAAEATAAALAERNRLAREMHDVLAHSLSALALQLESTRLLAREHDADDSISRALDQAHQLAVAGLDDARRAIAAARGEELPGPERIEELAVAFGDQSGVPVSVEVHGEPRELPPDARLAVYRTAQEALTNVRRHAAAERVELSLEYREGSTVLVIEDHAAPNTPPPISLGAASSGYGLTGMRERAALLGGELLAAPTDDGFRLELRLPA